MTVNTRNRLSKTAAIRAAKGQVHKYRQGRGWIVSSLDEAAGAYRSSGELDYTMATDVYRMIVAYRALVALGLDEHRAAAASWSPGTVEERVAHGLEQTETQTRSIENMSIDPRNIIRGVVWGTLLLASLLPLVA